MKKQEKIRLDPNKQALYFPGGCEEAATTCMALCCRNWNVLVDKNEEASHAYEVETVCICTDRGCANRVVLCLNRRTRLARRPDGSCVYLDGHSRCSIYATRPVACRAFTCVNGWKLSPRASDESPGRSEPDLQSVQFREHLRMDNVFAPNPAIGFKTSFYSDKDREIVLVVNRIDKCGTVSLRVFFDKPAVNDDIFSFIIHSFDGTRDCAAILRAVRDRFGIGLSDKDFLDIVLLLHSENLILFKMVPELKQ
jgi:Fe-S-cluster containining protein